MFSNNFQIDLYADTFIQIFSEMDTADIYTYPNQSADVSQHLRELFQIILLTFFVAKEPAISLESLCSLRKSVSMEDKVIENNLRMIESYLPELLFASSIVSNQGDSINELIQKLGQKDFPYLNTAYSTIFLRQKFIYLFEAILFADIFKSNWDGKIQADKCYVHKENNKLKYYHYYQIRPLLMQLLDNISIITESGVENGRSNTKIYFQIQ
jgi:hypothetical protein